MSANWVVRWQLELSLGVNVLRGVGDCLMLASRSEADVKAGVCYRAYHPNGDWSIAADCEEIVFNRQISLKRFTANI